MNTDAARILMDLIRGYPFRIRVQPRLVLGQLGCFLRRTSVKTSTARRLLLALALFGPHFLRAEPPRTVAGGTDDFIPFFISARYKNQEFALYQQRYQSYDGDRDRFYWSERIAFAILDHEGRVLWEMPRYSSALVDLFETARRKVANVEGIIDDLLSDNGEA